MQVLYNPVIQEQPRRITDDQKTQKPDGNFKAVFENTIEQRSVQFSKHASLRLAARNIDLSQSQIERVQNGMQQAGEKGIRSSLVMCDGVALLVNIPNKTIVTAINANTQNVFTNIDGAVIV